MHAGKNAPTINLVEFSLIQGPDGPSSLTMRAECKQRFRGTPETGMKN